MVVAESSHEGDDNFSVGNSIIRSLGMSCASWLEEIRVDPVRIHKDPGLGDAALDQHLLQWAGDNDYQCRCMDGHSLCDAYPLQKARRVPVLGDPLLKAVEFQNKRDACAAR